MDIKMKHIPITLIKKRDAGMSDFDKTYFWNQVAVREDTVDPENGGYVKLPVGISMGDGESDQMTVLRVSKLEKKLFDLLMQVVRESGCGSTLRVAGGWVRDKLRGDNSHDIDITLDNMMGEPFAELVNKHLEQHHQETHRIGVIQSNPEQSKHLETATVKIFDVWIDFVNLRSETYTDNSRIPEVKIGTPLEDALRRDLTINSLFFNINENRIEDFTKLAIKDLELGIIRTPLPPLTTFLDDPLRVYRSIRFASRMYFAIDEDLMKAASDTKVKEAIFSKISHERIAKEFDGMLTGPRPDLAMYLIHHLGLYQYLFSLPTNFKELDSVDYQRKSLDYINQMMRIVKWGSESDESSTSRIRLLTSLMIPFHNFTFKNTQKKNRICHLLQYILLDYLKLSNKDYDDVCLLLECSKLFLPLVKQFREKSVFDRKLVGLAVYKAGPLWRAALSIALVMDLPHHDFAHSFPTHNISSSDQSLGDFNHHTHCHPHHQPLSAESIALVKVYDEFCATIKSQDLVGVWNIKKILDGNQVKEILQKAPGAWLSPTLQAVFEWQLEHPTKSVEECTQWLVANFKDKK